MSILKVDTINEKTSGNGVAIPGHIIQVIQATGTTQTEVTAANTWTSVVPTATITPKFNNSKILITHSAGGMHYSNAGASSAGIRILRGSTNIASRARHTYVSHASNYMPNPWHIEFLDSPATTSAITYTIQILAEKAGNLRHNSIDTNISPSTSVGTTTLMEIAQ